MHAVHPPILLIAAIALLASSGFSRLDAAGQHYVLSSPSKAAREASLDEAVPSEDQRDPSLFAPGYYNGDPLPPSTIYLTFDDGPGDFTESILDTLRDKGVVATFFINSFVRNPARHSNPYANALLPHGGLLRRMVAEGHVIGNHTFSHRNLATQSADIIERELDLLVQHFKEAYGPDAPSLDLIRPPFGSPWLGKWNHDTEKRKVCDILANRGLVMMWGEMWDSTDSREWVKGEWYTKASKLYNPDSAAYQKKINRNLQRLLKMADGTRSGVILMHDVHPTSRDMLPLLIDALKQRGYVFQTMEDYARWRWGPHAFDRYHLNDPDAFPKAPELPGITQALLASRPFPPNQATAPRLGLSQPPNQATAPRLAYGKSHPALLALADWGWNGKTIQTGSEGSTFPAWFPRFNLPPPSEYLTADQTIATPEQETISQADQNQEPIN